MFLIFFHGLLVIKVEYKDNSICAPKHAINATFEFNFSKGAYYNFLNTRKNIGCWVNSNTERGKRILEGKSIRIPQKNNR